MDLKYNISTITMSMRIPDCTLNLMNIGKYMNIDNNIIGIKYNFGKSSILKGEYSTSVYKKSRVKNTNKINKRLFYNQVTLIIQFKNNTNELHYVNVKLFGNGSVHLTGVKNPDDGKIIMNILYSKLLLLIDKYDNILITLDSNNVYIDNDKNVYSANNHTIIGYKYTNELDEILYNIKKKDYQIDIRSGFFISNKFESKRTKQILNFDGNNIGYSKIILLKNKKKLYKNNDNIHFDYMTGFIYYDSDGKSIIIGNIIYEYNTDTIPVKNIIEYKYNCNPFSNDSIIHPLLYIEKCSLDQLDFDINCINIYLKLDFELNRQRLFNELLQYTYSCEYKPEKYSGVKFQYKLSKNNKNGICSCTTKCTCTTITFLIFQSGNIIVTGFKSIIKIQPIINEFQILINNIKDNIRKRIFM